MDCGAAPDRGSHRRRLDVAVGMATSRARRAPVVALDPSAAERLRSLAGSDGVPGWALRRLQGGRRVAYVALVGQGSVGTRGSAALGN